MILRRSCFAQFHVSLQHVTTDKIELTKYCNMNKEIRNFFLINIFFDNTIDSTRFVLIFTVGFLKF